MSNDTDDQFSFYPYVRQGYRPENEFETGSLGTDTSSTDVTLDLEAEGPEGSTTKQPSIDVTVYGPGDVDSIDTDQVVRVEPEPDTAEFPPNYFPLVEFDDPGLPWQFSPEQANDRGQNRPWLCLVVVPRQSVAFKPAGRGPLPVLETPASELPDPEESWAWAHAQIVGRNTPREFNSRSTRTVSRLLCPRNLDPKTKYRACVVPTFEPGRRAGLGLKDPYQNGRDSIGFAWTDEDSIRLPVYHTWTFSTAPEGDFEALARELTPTRVGDDVGFRTVDVSNPGPTSLKLPADPATDTGTVGLGGALKSASAAPDEYDESMQAELRELLNNPNKVLAQTDYGAVGPPLYGRFHAGVPTLVDPGLNNEDFYFPKWLDTLNADPRNRIAAGIGAQVIRDEQDRLMRSAWEQFGEIEEANERLRRLRFAEMLLSKQHEELSKYPTGSLLGLSSPIHGTMLDGEQTLKGTAEETDLPSQITSSAFRKLSRPTGPMARRGSVSLDTSDLVTRIETGRIPRMTDSLGVTTEVDGAEGDSIREGQQVSAGESGQRPEEPRGAESGEVDHPPAVGERGQSGGSDQQLASGVGRQPDFEGGLPPSGQSPDGEFGTPMSGDLPSSGADGEEPDGDVQAVLTAVDGLEAHVDAARGAIEELSRALEDGDVTTIKAQTEQRPTVLDRSESIDRNTIDPLSRALGKLLTKESPPLTQSTANEHLNRLHSAQRDLMSAVRAAVEVLGQGENAGPARERLQEALSALDTLTRTTDGIRAAVRGQQIGEPMEVQSLTDLDVESNLSAVEPAEPSPGTIEMPSTDSLRETLLSELDPTPRLHRFAEDVTGIEGLGEREDPIKEVLASPKFPNPPAYELLKEYDREAFLPGIGDLPENSISVLQTNPEFIEAFMAGLNHEMARELNWRNYPTDRRGSYFRWFWDSRGNPHTDPKKLEQSADIEPMHTWDENDLGENSTGDDDESVVLLIRGELLRRFPNTDVFAAKAVSDEGGIDVALTEGEDGDRIPALPDTNITREDSEKADIKFPEFRGQLDPDITFFKFDLTPEEALYEPYEDDGGRDDAPNEGWFFVLEEPPAETRFGLDAEADDENLVGTIPYGMQSDARSGVRKSDLKPREVEAGWSGLAWPHLVSEGEDPSDVTYVDVNGSRPGRENWRVEKGTSFTTSSNDKEAKLGKEAAAKWGYNSAHMARITWQLPVRISIHADDMIHESTTNPTEGTDE